MTRLSAKTAVVTYKSDNAEKSRLQAVWSIALFMVVFPLPVVYPLVMAKTVISPVEILFVFLSIASAFWLFRCLSNYTKARDSRLIFNEDGLVLPRKQGDIGDGARGLSWGQVERIFVEPLGKSDEKIVFRLGKGGETIAIKTSSLGVEELDKLISACDLWAEKTSRDKSFDNMVEKVVRGRVEAEQTSFTGIWMEEAERRISTTPFQPLEPGTRLQDGRIKIIQLLTAGGWSAIYLCEWKGKTPAILKEAVVPPTANESLKEKAREHFEREAVLLSGLEHPRVARVIDYFVENSRQYMLLERINGSTLRNYVRDRGAVSEHQALIWAREIAEIVSYLHSRTPPIIHRDLTPENLVLDMRGSLVLVDFGAANEFVGTVTGTLVGKPSYIAPEQFSGRACLESDLYSLGAVLHFMLTAKEPEPLSVNSPRKINAQVSEAFDTLVQDLMTLAPSGRIASAEEVGKRLSNLF